MYAEGSDGTLYEVRNDCMSQTNGTTPIGELSIKSEGFEGDEAGAADLNMNGEAYQIRIEA